MNFRRIELIAPEEIASAILAVTQQSFGMERENVPAEVLKLIGFGRTSEEARLVVERETHLLLASGQLELRGTTLICA